MGQVCKSHEGMLLTLSGGIENVTLGAKLLGKHFCFTACEEGTPPFQLSKPGLISLAMLFHKPHTQKFNMSKHIIMLFSECKLPTLQRHNTHTNTNIVTQTPVSYLTKYRSKK
jgi:hypothetical protein